MKKGAKGYLCIPPPSLVDDICRIHQLIYEKGFYIKKSSNPLMYILVSEKIFHVLYQIYMS